ncbi:hypothetical protein GGR56DRAFT_670328 [Xylariaceae sp. FL0804]|nr:hypothetical protein GGR56DRAFT_670328 [Xylariaceae sp. FL0804]
MLLRQLQRPLSRSVAAAWRPVPVALLHGSVPQREECAGGPSGEAQQQQQQQQPPAPLELTAAGAAAGAAASSSAASAAATLTGRGGQRPSLYERFYPDEEPPRLALDDEFPDELGDDEVVESGVWDPDDAALRAKSMLILSGASKHLLESDFLRLGPKGKHVDGWVSGILKVIQRRDTDTLEPLGSYFILFDRPEAATAYEHEVKRLWELGKEHVPGAHHGRRPNHSDASLVTPPGLRVVGGEDVGAALRSYTLVPPSLPRHLFDPSPQSSRQQQQQQQQQQRQRGGGPRAWAAELDGGGTLVERLRRRCGSRHLVLVGVEGGRLAPAALRSAIDDDSRDRNLPWRLAGTGLDSILPFGSSVRRPAFCGGGDDDIFDDDAYVNNNNNNNNSNNNDGGGAPDIQQQQQRPGQQGRRRHDDWHNRRYPRFIVPLADGPEAHRFAQGFHRRALTLRMRFDDGREWEESRVLSAEVVW